MTDGERADMLAQAIVATLWDDYHLWTCDYHEIHSVGCSDADCKRLREALMATGYEHLIDIGQSRLEDEP